MILEKYSLFRSILIAIMTHKYKLCNRIKEITGAQIPCLLCNQMWCRSKSVMWVANMSGIFVTQKNI